MERIAEALAGAPALGQAMALANRAQGAEVSQGIEWTLGGVYLTVDLAMQRAWARGWQAAGEALDGVRRTELRTLTADRALAATHRLLSLGAEARLSPKRRRTSGLVEQQRLFSGSRP